MRKVFVICGILLLIGGVFLALFLSLRPAEDGGNWFFTPDVQTGTYATVVLDAQEMEKNDTLTANAAIRDQNITLCERINNTEKRITCQDMIHANIAQSTNNIEGCDLLSQSGMIQTCRDNITVTRAQSAVDKTQCDTIAAKNLRTYCEKEIDVIRLQKALAENTISQAFCRSLVEDVRPECDRSLIRTDNTTIYALALEQKDPKKCTTLTDDTFRTNCHDAVVLQLAFSEKNPDYCDSIGDTTKKTYCQNTLYKQSDAARFQDIVSGGDVAGCNSLSDKKLQYQCSDMITLAQVRETHNEALCANLFNTGMQFACAQIAKAQ